MWLVVGLGNPGAQYTGTRHNIGFMLVDALAQGWSASSFQQKFSAQVATGCIAQQNALLVKPQTYMNHSGQAVSAAMAYRKTDAQHVIVVHDDLDLAPGLVRIKMGGSHGGHNGVRDIISHVGDDFVRVRLGIGRPAIKGQEAQYVLQRFASSQLPELTQQLTVGCEAIEEILCSGVVAAQQRFHGASASHTP
ncbi:MAG: aminoacyl-tRNA hydrolase [Myxococcota bacterium]